jgi:hypothetical protein
MQKSLREYDSSAHARLRNTLSSAWASGMGNRMLALDSRSLEGIHDTVQDGRKCVIQPLLSHM